MRCAIIASVVARLVITDVILNARSVIRMSNQCYVCAKGTVAGNTVSHSNIHTKRVFKPNLKKVRIIENGTVKSVSVCTRCLRSGKVERA